MPSSNRRSTLAKIEQPKSPLNSRRNKTSRFTQDSPPPQTENLFSDKCVTSHHKIQPKKTKLLGRLSSRPFAKSHDSKSPTKVGYFEGLFVHKSASFPSVKREFVYQNAKIQTSSHEMQHLNNNKEVNNHNDLKRDEVLITTPRSIAKTFNPLDKENWEKSSVCKRNGIAQSCLEAPIQFLEFPQKTLPVSVAQKPLKEEACKLSVREPVSGHRLSSQFSCNESSTLYTSCSSSISMTTPSSANRRLSPSFNLA